MSAQEWGVAAWGGEGSVAGRLRYAIEEFGPRPLGRPGSRGSIKGFTDLLQGMDLKGAGTSYRMVHFYLNEDSGHAPSDAFLEAAAQVRPSVRLEWLRDGTGHPTHDEAVVRAPSGFRGATPAPPESVHRSTIRIFGRGVARVMFVWDELAEGGK